MFIFIRTHTHTHIYIYYRILSKEVGKQYFRVTDKSCETWHWWRVVCVCLLHHITIHHKRIIGYDTGWCETWHQITIHHKRIRGYDTGWWRRAVVRKGSGDEGKWWLWERLWHRVVTKGSGDEEKWWGREVVTMGEWWRREVVTLGSGD